MEKYTQEKYTLENSLWKNVAVCDSMKSAHMKRGFVGQSFPRKV